MAMGQERPAIAVEPRTNVASEAQVRGALELREGEHGVALRRVEFPLVPEGEADSGGDAELDAAWSQVGEQRLGMEEVDGADHGGPAGTARGGRGSPWAGEHEMRAFLNSGEGMVG